MSYAGLAGISQPITAGTLAKVDPFVSRASLMASNVMKRMAELPKPQRREWLRGQLNGLWPNMGNEVLANISEIANTTGKSQDQAIFDAIRLALANRMMTWAGQQAEHRGMSGLGDFASDARTFACTSASMGATVGGFIGAFRPGSDTSILGGATTASGISNCNLETLRLQADIAASQANAAATLAASDRASSRQMLLIGTLGVVGIIGAVAAFKAMKK